MDPQKDTRKHSLNCLISVCYGIGFRVSLSLSANFFAPKMANEDVSLLFTA